MKLRKLITTVVSMAFACAMLATTAPTLADEWDGKISVPVELDIESDIFKTRYGTWKEEMPFILEVDGVKTELKKDGNAVDVKFATKDIIKLYAGDEFILFEGYASNACVLEADAPAGPAGSKYVSFTLTDNCFESTKYNITFENGKVVISATRSGGGGMAGVIHQDSKGIHWTLNVEDTAGNPIKGISITDTSIYFDPWTDVCNLSSGLVHNIDESGSTFFYELYEKDVDGDGYMDDMELGETYLKNLTDTTGFTSSNIDNVFNYGETPHLSARKGWNNEGLYEVFYNTSVFVENEYIDFDDEYISISKGAIPENIGEAKETYGEIPVWSYQVRNVNSEGPEKLELKDKNGDLIATIEYSVNVLGNYKEDYLLVGKIDWDLAIDLLVVTPEIKVTMAENMTNWTVTTSYSEDTVYIKAVESVSDVITPEEPEKPAIIVGWKKDSTGWWYQNPDGTYPANCWKFIENKWYAFNKNGYMREGWFNDGGIYYYLVQGSGYMATGWVNDGGTWYYMKSSGAMAKGWVNVGGVWYYMKSSGAMATGWINDGGTWYYMNSNGAMAKGWVNDGGTWYYMKSSGAMATGWIQVGSTWYYLYSNGAMAKNTWIGSYYVNANGAWVV